MPLRVWPSSVAHLGLLAEADAAEVGLGDVDGEPGVSRGRSRPRGRAPRAAAAPRLGELLGDDARHRARDRGVLQLLLELGDAGVGRRDARARAASISSGRDPASRRRERCSRAASRPAAATSRRVRASSRDLVVPEPAVEQPLHALEVLLARPRGRPRRAPPGPRASRDVLAARARPVAGAARPRPGRARPAPAARASSVSVVSMRASSWPAVTGVALVDGERSQAARRPWWRRGPRWPRRGRRRR